MSYVIVAWDSYYPSPNNCKGVFYDRTQAEEAAKGFDHYDHVQVYDAEEFLKGDTW